MDPAVDENDSSTTVLKENDVPQGTSSQSLSTTHDVIPAFLRLSSEFPLTRLSSAPLQLGIALIVAINVILFSLGRAGILTAEPISYRMHLAFALLTAVGCVVLLGISGFGFLKTVNNALEDRRISLLSVVPGLVYAITLLTLSYGLLVEPEYTVEKYVAEQCFSILFLLEVWRNLGRLLASVCEKEMAFLGGTADSEYRVYGSDEIFHASSESEVERQPKLVSVEKIGEGDLVLLREGEILPGDGVIARGKALVEECRFGALLVSKAVTPGDYLYAGSRVCNGEVTVRVEQVAAESPNTIYRQSFFQLLSSLSRWQKGYFLNENLLFYAALFLSACAGIYWYKAGLVLTQALLVGTGVLLATLLVSYVVFVIAAERISFFKLFRKGVFPARSDLVSEIHEVKDIALNVDTLWDYVADEVVEFSLIDSRVDRKQILTTLYDITSSADEHEYGVLREYFREESDSAASAPNFDAIEAIQDYAGCGLAVKYRGANISLGNEEFLLERGVQIQHSEIETESLGDRWYYLAVERDLIAKIHCRNGMISQVQRFAQKLLSQGRNVWLYGQELSAESLDEIGKEAGLDLAYVKHGGLDQFENRERMLIVSVGAEGISEDREDIIFRDGQTYQGTTSKNEVFFFNNDLATRFLCILESQMIARLKKGMYGFLCFVSVLCLLLSVLQSVSPFDLVALHILSLALIGVALFVSTRVLHLK